MTVHKIILVLLAAGAAWLVHAQTTPGPVLQARGAFIALSVADIEASSRWYREKLGLAVTFSPPRTGPASVQVLEGGGLTVELIQHDDALPLSRVTPARAEPFLLHGYFKAGVIVEDLDATLARLKARDVPIAFGPFEARDGRPANFIIRDNAGNLIHFHARRREE